MSMEQGVRRGRRLGVFLAVAMGWAALVGLALFLTRTALDSVVGIAALALLYMPAPFVAAVVAERGLVRRRFRLPARSLRQIAVFLLAPPVAIVAFALAYLAIALIGGDLLGLPGVGHLALTSEEVARAARSVLGPQAVQAAGPPPPGPVLLIASIWGAVLAGWTLNGLFAMGEEYGWRGFMWDALKARGPARANLIIGVVWGLWHAPLILQGYNYPGQAALGVLAMVVFCTGMSFLLTALRELTGSVLPAAAAHGTFNGLAAVLILVTPGADRVLGGPLGLISSAVLLAIGLVIGRLVERSGVRTEVAPAAERSVDTVLPKSS